MPTIGVSIAIPSPHAEMLQAKRASFGDPLADSIPTHVTLLPPTEVEPERMDDVNDHLAQAAASREPFPMVLRGTGTFRPISPVVFVQVSGGIGECELLEKAVRRGPLRRKLDFYYHPHVTVAHNVPSASLDRAFSELADYSVAFEVDAYLLYELGDDAVWRPVHEFALDGD